VKNRCGIGTLDILKERGVNRAGRVVKGQEHHSSTRADRRCLSGDLDPGDPYLGAAARSEQLAGPGHSERVQQGA